LQDLQEKQGKLAAAKNKLKVKKNFLLGSVMDDTPDLFGNRKAAMPDKLFDVRVEPGKIAEALAPIHTEISVLEKEIDVIRYKIIQAENNPEQSLFDLAG
jgi:hypothetical protein